ncbi:MAG TPA: phosphatidate cytidylyltransferase [Sedimentisphaerales bacterium]|nr:phosphatidate cytidylyltransferase [Sedimentisphaerales bacterium]
MLKYRLIFGTLMTAFFVAVVMFDGWLDGSICKEAADKEVQGTILWILISMLAVPAQLELASLAKTREFKVFTPVTIAASILLASSWYLPDLINIPRADYVIFVVCGTLIALFLYQGIKYQTDGVISNCSVSLFSVIYLGGLSSFVLGIRVVFGLWPLLMFVFVVKFADIGAYTVGRIFGKHKFSPKISPGKTWEGIAGAVVASVIVAVVFAVKCDIMHWSLAILFGGLFAFIGQFGDLAESMIKRDAQRKDSSSSVPGFGGVLDVIDSPLVAGLFAYLFFCLAM